MRQLNSHELFEKFKDYSFDIEISSFEDSKIKINQFIYFLYSQDISKRILERISEDFKDLNLKLSSDSCTTHPKEQREIKESLVSRELQGAFGFFTINKKYNDSNKNSRDYIDLVRDWNYYGRGDDYHNFMEDFMTHFFKPFKELFEWYLSESESLNKEDYFSIGQQNRIIDEIQFLRDTLNRIELKLDLTGEILDNHLEDLEKLVKKLNKKNFLEIIKGKFGDEILSKLISIEAFSKLIEVITGEKLNLLN